MLKEEEANLQQTDFLILVRTKTDTYSFCNLC